MKGLLLSQPPDIACPDSLLATRGHLPLPYPLPAPNGEAILRLSYFLVSKLWGATGPQSYDRPVSPQRERDVGSNAIAAFPSGEASHSFSS